MSASFYDMMCYAKIGIAAPDMTAYDKVMALRMHGSMPITTITGIPPINFKADGRPLTAWSIDGNSRQSETPAPDAPVSVDGCGDKTYNLLPLDIQTQTINGVKFTINSAAGTVTLSGSMTADTSTVLSIPIPSNLSGDYYMSGCPSGGSYSTYDAFVWDKTAGARPKKWDDSTASDSDFGAGNVEIKLIAGHSNDYRIRPRYGIQYSDDIVFHPMIRIPSAPSDFEPYGYCISITSAGQTQNVYLGQVPTTRRIGKMVLDGTNTKFVSKAQAGSFVIRINDGKFHEIASLCSHFIYSPIISENPGHYFIPAAATSNQFNFWWDSTKTLTEANQWLSDQYAAGTPVTVWYVLANEQTGIVNEPLMKIGSYADELHSADAGIVIPTVRGSNTLTVDTDLLPSSVSITGHIKPL